MIRLGLAGSALLVLTYGALALHRPGALTVGSPAAKYAFVATLGVSAAVYLLAVAVVQRGSGDRGAIWMVLLVAAALRVGPLLTPPFLSGDMYRYLWDGRVQQAGINPYRYVPADPALATLRDDVVYPNINRADYAPTIYPPMAEAIFAAVTWVAPGPTFMKLAMVGFEAVAMLCLVSLLRLARLPAERILIYAWNPLPIWAFAGNGHVDAAAIGLIAGALLLRVTRRDGWAGLVLGSAILVKFLPAIIAPALWRRSARWRFALACGLAVIVLYVPYLSVGRHVLGFLAGYGAEEGLVSGSGIWLLAGLGQIVSLPAEAGVAYMAATLFLLAGLAWWVAFVRRPDDPVAICAAAGMLIAVLTVAISPHYPWYFAWLALPAVLVPYRAVVWLSVAPVLLYLDINGDRFVWPSVIYLPAIALAATDWWRRRRTLEPLRESLR